MSIAGITYVQLTGTYIDINGNPMQGQLVFQAVDGVSGNPIYLTATTPADIVMPSTIVGRLSSGALSVQLPATDSSNMSPTGFLWSVTEQIPGGRSYKINLTSSQSPGPVNIDTLTPASTTNGPVYLNGVTSFNTRFGAVTLAAADLTALTTQLAAADTSLVVGGSTLAPTVRTNTLDVIATQHPAAADWSNNSHKITSLANGSGAQDAAAFGQIPVPANGYGISGNTGATPTPAVALTSGESFITVDVSLPNNTNEAITSIALAAGTWLICGRAWIVNTSAASVSNVDMWIGPNSASTTGAYAALSAILSTTATGDAVPFTIMKIVTLGSPTTVYLNAGTNVAATAKAGSVGNNIPNCSGITAVRIA